MAIVSSTVVTPLAARFRVENDAGGVRIVAPAQRLWFHMLFLPVWLCGWTLGGFTVIVQLFSKPFQPFLAVWLGAWAFGELFALATLVWMIRGRETIAVERGRLVLGAEIPLYTRRRVYDVAVIRDLKASSVAGLGWRGQQGALPLLRDVASGCVSFSYGARTIFWGAGLDEAEGRNIVEILRKQLPKSAFEPA